MHPFPRDWQAPLRPWIMLADRTDADLHQACPMDASAPAARRRRWLSLLTGRWHTSSRVVTVLLSLVLVFCNVPGQSVRRIWYEIGHPFYVKAQFEHGWPLTYMIRTDEIGNVFGNAPAQTTVRECFEVWRDCEEIRFWSLLANCCVVLLASLASGVAFETWRRQRIRIWHIHLSDLFAAILAVSLVAAWYVHEQQRHAREEASISPPGGGSGNPTIQLYQAGGITWLRMCLGDESFRFLDRPFEVAVAEGDDWSQLEKLTSVRHVDAQVRATTEELDHLAKMPQLEALSLDEFLSAPPDNVVAELPPLSKLRGLYLSQPAHRCRRIDRLTSLEALRITVGCIDEQVLREISVLPNIRELALNGLSESADLSFLPSRPRLLALDLYHSEVSGLALKSIGQCPRLKELSLYMCRVDGNGIRHLSELANLETLDLQYTNVTDGDLVALATLKRLRELELTGTGVGGDLRFMSALENLETLTLYNTKVTGADLALLIGLKHLRSLDLGYTSIGTNGKAYLRQMKQLRWLRVSNFDEDERKALQAALPECEILRH